MIKTLNKRLHNIRIVLVETSHPGNIGAAARAMKTMCLSRLVLVKPRFFPHADATARASGADDLLAQAHVVDSLDEALNGCQLVIGASARLRRLEWPQLDPTESAQQALTEAEQGEVALVFGRELSGLSNEELERCHFLMHIATNPDFSSLNLGAAVQVVCYEMLKQAQRLDSVNDGASENAMNRGAEDEVETEPDLYATSEQFQFFYEHLEKVLTDIGFLDPKHPRKMMRRLKRLFNRTRMSLVEMNIMRGILSGIEKTRK